MKANGRSMMACFPMVKGEKPYDQAAVDAALTELEDDAPRSSRPCFPKAQGLKLAKATYSSSPRSGQTRPVSTAKVASFAKALTEAKGKIKDPTA